MSFVNILSFLAFLLILFPTTDSAYCPVGYFQFNQNCYFFSYNKLSWSRASDFCADGNGYLTSVESAFENSKILEIFDAVDTDFNDMWSGGNNLADVSIWQWSDGKPFSYQHWKTVYPIDAQTNNCIVLDRSDGRYMNANCRDSKHFLCKFSQNFTASPCVVCPIGYEMHNLFCYKVTLRSSITFQQAESICVQEGGHLASIHSVDENDFIFGLATQLLPNPVNDACDKGPSVWIGLMDPLQNRQWQWTDGTAVDFFNWYSGNPDNGCNRDEYCTIFSHGTTSRGRWHDRRCSYAAQLFVCKQAAGSRK